MRYDLIDLRLFMNVGETHNLTRAAEKTFLSLPAASARIKNMEDVFKVQLLVRHATGVQLTSAGEVLLKHARHIFAELEHLHANLQPYANGIKGRLKVFANTSATNSFLADALSRFLMENPEVDIELEERLSREIVQAIRVGSADLGIVAGTVDLDGLEVFPLYEDRLIVVAGEQHPLAKEVEVSFADIVEKHSFVGIQAKSALQNFLEDIAIGMGRRLNQRIYVGSFDAVCRMVEAGVGIAITPSACVQEYSRLSTLKQITLTDPWAIRPRYLCRQKGKDLPQFAENFVRCLIDVAKVSE